MTTLLVDAGNTRIKWAIVSPGAPLGAWDLADAAAHAELDAMAQTWRRAGVTRAVVSNVAGAAVREHIAASLPPGVDVEWFASTLTRAGLHNGYRNPGQLGCDRFAAAIGARALAPGQDVVVATCGTATTVDAVSADGHFIGGMILPGVALMAASLARNTAQLPLVPPGTAQGSSTAPVFGDNTDDAIVSGILSAQAGAIERACAAHAATACIVSGGAAPYIAPALKLGHRVVDNIVLVGLHAATGAD